MKLPDFSKNNNFFFNSENFNYSSDRLENRSADILQSPASGIEYKKETSLFSYIRLKFNYLVTLFKTNENSNFFIDLFNNDTNNTSSNQEKMYNQSLFIFKNITWSNIVLKLKINNINISGGSSSNRHILTTSDILLSHYLSLIVAHNRDVLVVLGYSSYKYHKEILSNPFGISMNSFIPALLFNNAFIHKIPWYINSTSDFDFLI